MQVMPFFAVAVSSITSAFFSPSRDYLKSQVRTWCLVFVGIGVAAFIAGLLQVKLCPTLFCCNKTASEGGSLCDHSLRPWQMDYNTYLRSCMLCSTFAAEF